MTQAETSRRLPSTDIIVRPLKSWSSEVRVLQLINPIWKVLLIGRSSKFNWGVELYIIRLVHAFN